MEQPQILWCILIVAGMLAIYSFGMASSKNKKPKDKRDPYDNYYGDESF